MSLTTAQPPLHHYLSAHSSHGGQRQDECLAHERARSNGSSQVNAREQPGVGPSGLGQTGAGGEASGSAPKLAVPFFRWFGPTAYTPGFKRIRVEVQQDDADTPDNEPAFPSTGHLPPFASSSNANVSYNTTPFTTQRPLSSPQSHSPHSPHSSPSPESTSSASNFHPSPDAFGSSKSQDSSKSKSDALKRHRSACYKGGKRKNEVVDELLEHLLEVFFRDLGCHFPFMSKTQILEQHQSKTLPSLLSNAICAIASRFSSHPLLLPLRSDPSRIWESAIVFEETAKKLLVPLLSFPSVETASALVLLAWNEFGSGRDSGLWMFVGMSIRIIQDLGMSHEASIVRETTPFEIAQRRLLFWSVFFLDRVICYGTGRAVTLAESDIDVLLPSPADCDLVSPLEPIASSNLAQIPVVSLPINPWPALIMIVVHRGRISDCLNTPAGGATEPKNRERLENMQADLINYYSNMPASLQFSVQSFKTYRDLQQAPAFLLLHLLFHSVITVLHRPSIMQLFSADDQVLLEPNIEVSRSSARTLANMLSYADTAGSIAILANPFADQAIFICAVAFLDERSTLECSRRLDLAGLSMTSTNTSNAKRAAGNVSGSGSGSKTPNTTRLLRSFTTSKVTVSISALKTIISHWAGVGWVLRTVDQKERGLLDEEVDPDFNDQDGQEGAFPTLFPKDPALLKSWLKREWVQGRGKVGAGQGEGPAGGAAASPSAAGGMGYDGDISSIWADFVGHDPSMFLEHRLSFTGQTLDASHGLTMSLDAPDFNSFHSQTLFPASGIHNSHQNNLYPSYADAHQANHHHQQPQHQHQHQQHPNQPFSFEDQLMGDGMTINDLPSNDFFSDLVLGGGGTMY